MPMKCGEGDVSCSVELSCTPKRNVIRCILMNDNLGEPFFWVFDDDLVDQNYRSGSITMIDFVDSPVN